MKWSGTPFTHICEWKRRSPSSSYSGWLGQILVVATVAQGSTSIIHFPPVGFDSKSESTFDSEAFSSSMSDFLERHSSVLCQGILWYSHHFPVSFFVFSLPLLCCDLDWLSWGRPYQPCPLLFGLGLPFPYFSCEGFAYPNSRRFFLNFCLILIMYL